MISLHNYETQTFTKKQEQAINRLHNAIEHHFEVMGIDTNYTNNVWEYIDGVITEQILQPTEEF